MREPRKLSNVTNPSRRRFIKASTLTGAALAAGTSMGQTGCGAEQQSESASEKLKLTVTGYEVDRVMGFADGRVGIDGCDMSFETAKIGEMNTHIFSGPRTREVSEVGLLPFILAHANEKFRDYTLIPVFPLRAFRHKSIFVRTDRGIAKPEDLRGKKVATPGYSSTSLTWIRGILQQEYGVKPEEIQWVVSSLDSSAKASGGASKLENVLPKGISVSTGPPGKDESDLLTEGHVDALFHAAEPRAFQQGHPNVARLFADVRKTERAYFSKTGIFPIMHAVAVRRNVMDENTWLPEAVFRAFSRSKQLMYDDLRKTAWYRSSLPWIAQEAEETRQLMGENYWPYGVGPNRKALEALLEYSYQQGLATRKLKMAELFHPSTLDLKEETT